MSRLQNLQYILSYLTRHTWALFLLVIDFFGLQNLVKITIMKPLAFESSDSFSHLSNFFIILLSFVWKVNFKISQVNRRMKQQLKISIQLEPFNETLYLEPSSLHFGCCSSEFTEPYKYQTSKQSFQFLFYFKRVLTCIYSCIWLQNFQKIIWAI